MSDNLDIDGLAAPLPLAVRSLLRTATVEHARSERRWVFPAQIHVGTPGGFRISTRTDEAPADFGTRVDLIHAMVRRAHGADVSTPTGVPWVWLTRGGAAAPDALEFGFLAPAMHAYAEVEEPLTFIVVTRLGWHDPRSGLHRSWTRLRAA